MSRTTSHGVMHVKNKTKEIPVPVLLSITSGINLVGDFSKVHAAIEFLSGHAVWTHQLPRVSEELTPQLVEDYDILDTDVPELDGKEEVDSFLKEEGIDNKMLEVSPYDIDQEDPIESAEKIFDGELILGGDGGE